MTQPNQAEDITKYLDVCVEWRDKSAQPKTHARISPPMAAFLADHPEFLEAYKTDKGICGTPMGEPDRLFLCIGPEHDESVVCPQPPSLTELVREARTSQNVDKPNLPETWLG